MDRKSKPREEKPRKDRHNVGADPDNSGAVQGHKPDCSCLRCFRAAVAQNLAWCNNNLTALSQALQGLELRYDQLDVKIAELVKTVATVRENAEKQLRDEMAKHHADDHRKWLT